MPAPDRIMLHLLRHAHAGDPEAWHGPDAERPLSKRGRAQAERLGRVLRDGGLRPDRILTSPKLRAVETAEIVGEALGLDVTTEPRLANGFDLDELDDLLADIGAAAPMLVGHDPDFTWTLQGLCDSDALVMRKGALAVLEVGRPLRRGGAIIHALVPPDALAER
jgi:phosphohistidine phosphatase SixA